MPLLLTKAQAQAIYNAMAELNNISARINVRVPFANKRTELWVFENAEGGIEVVAHACRESPDTAYPNQAAFAAAYDLLP